MDRIGTWRVHRVFPDGLGLWLACATLTGLCHSNLFVSSYVWSWRGILVKLVMHQISVDEIENPCYWINRCRFDMVIPSILSTQYWASLIFSPSIVIGKIDHFCVPRGQWRFFIKIKAKASICSWEVCFCCCECRNETKAFFKNFFAKKKFFCSKCDLVLFWPNPEIWSDFLFSNARLVVSACPADCLVFFFGNWLHKLEKSWGRAGSDNPFIHFCAGIVLLPAYRSSWDSEMRFLKN